MKKPHIYLISVFITLLLIFSLIGTAGSAVLVTKALNADTAVKVVEDSDIAATVHEVLVQEFQQQENTTGIPASVFAESITEEKCDAIIRESIKNGFDYLHGRTANVGAEPDFSGLEKELRTFLATYAEENDIPQDDNYEAAVKRASAAAEERILDACDVFAFRKLDSAGMMKKAQKVVSHSALLLIGCVLLSLILLLILYGVQHDAKDMVLYWVGIAVLIGSILLLIPSVWLLKEMWFDRFAVKSDQIFAAVTGYLYSLTISVKHLAITANAFGVACLFLFALIHRGKLQQESLKNAKH